MNRVPANEEGWATAPYEAQYLKLIDTTSKNERGAAAADAGLLTKHAVLTRSYDNNRTGANTNEESLTPSALKTRGLRRVFSLKVEGDDPNIEAQPLYVPDVQMSDGTKHDVVYMFSRGPVLPPGTDLLIGAGKDGVLYVLDRNNMGKSIGDFSKLKAPQPSSLSIPIRILRFTGAPHRREPGFQAAARLENASPARLADLLGQRQTWSDALRLGRKCRAARLRPRPLWSRQAARARVRAGLWPAGNGSRQYGRDADLVL